MDPKYIDLECSFCHKLFTRVYKQYKYQKRISGENYKPVCSNKCGFDLQKKSVVVDCDYCGAKVERNPSKLSLHNFCNNSCSASFTNIDRFTKGFTTAGKKKLAFCLDCNVEFIASIHQNKDGRCKTCKIKHKQKYNEEYNKNHPILNCSKCGVLLDNPTMRLYCDVCLKEKRQQSGRNSAASQQRRSKNEIYFSELCAKQFNITTNEQFFKDNNGNYWDADIILHDHKVAVLWNGQWHYKQISKKQSLAQVQSRDKIKHSVIIDNGYKLYVIKDMGKHNPKFVEEQFQKFVAWITK